MPNCPVHPHMELRYEHSRLYGPSGFCLICAKFYPLCPSMLGTRGCSHLRDHRGRHEHIRGQEVLASWTGHGDEAKKT